MGVDGGGNIHNRQPLLDSQSPFGNQAGSGGQGSSPGSYCRRSVAKALNVKTKCEAFLDRYLLDLPMPAFLINGYKLFSGPPLTPFSLSLSISID